MKTRKKLLSLLLAVAMALTMLPTVAFAADDRIPIKTVEATSDIAAPVYGATIKNPTFSVTQGSPAYFLRAGSSAKWQKKSGDSWISDGGTFTEGTWRFETQVRIDEEDGTTHVLLPPLNVRVNGALWLENGTPEVYGTYSSGEQNGP